MTPSAGPWTKAKKSGGTGQCVEMRSTGELVEVRDSKDPDGPRLRFTPAELDAWLDGAKNGEFDRLL